MSRILDAAVLVDRMKEPVVLPSQFASFEVPSSDELGEDHAAKREAFQQVSNWLASHGRGRILRNEEVQANSFSTEKLDNCIVHCAMHGIFDEEYKVNPYTHSGLLVASDGMLPKRITSLDHIQPNHLLSPEKLMEMTPGLDNSHVTLQACVSGLAKEGVGRDQLGLEWALTYCGAESLLSTHWNVSIEICF